MAKNEGKKFEEDIEKSAPASWFVYRLKDSSGSWSNTGVSRFTPTNMCDFFIYTGEMLYGVECKSFKGKSMPYSLLNDKKDKKINQLCDMNLRQPGRAYGCYFLNFRDVNETYLIGSIILRRVRDKSTRKSLSIAEARENGTLIPQKLKKVRYKYDLQTVL